MDDIIKKAMEQGAPSGPWKVPPEARSIVCYFRGHDGDEVTAWHDGALVQTARLRVRGGLEFGYAFFDVPGNATTLTIDHKARRAIFA